MSVFYKPNDVDECPLCGMSCTGSYFPHLLSPCSNLPIVLNSDAGSAFFTLLQLGQ
jgi:hypothetical protein